jgi:hypothetical protein
MAQQDGVGTAQRAAERSNYAYGINVSVCVFMCVCVRVGDPNGGMAASRPEGSPPTHRAVPYPFVQ